jgi:hypothetical protein
MPRKADPSRRAARRRSAAEQGLETLPPQRKIPIETQAAQDSDFGLCMALVPALRRRTDA